MRRSYRYEHIPDWETCSVCLKDTALCSCWRIGSGREVYRTPDKFEFDENFHNRSGVGNWPCNPLYWVGRVGLNGALVEPDDEKERP